MRHVALRFVGAFLVLMLMTGVIAPGFTPVSRANPLLTVGAFLVTAQITKGLVGDLLGQVDSTAKSIMTDFHHQLSSLIDQVSADYGNALDTTLSSLDKFASQNFSRLALLLDDLNQKLLNGVAAIEQTTLNLMQQATVTVGTMLNQVEDLIVVGVKGVTYVIDKTTYNAIFLIAIVFLAVGLLFFVARLWKGLPTGGLARMGVLLFMVLYLGLFGSLLLPQVRVYAITMAGQAEVAEQIGSGPKIFAVTPRKLQAATNAQLTVTGANFDDGGAPTLTLSGQAVTPAAHGDSFVMLKLPASLATLNGSHPLVITTKEGKTVSTLVEFTQPLPPPQINSWRMVPTGKKREVQQFPGTHVNCTSKWDERRTVDEIMTVPAGWTLAIDPAYQGNVYPADQFQGSYPNPPLGYSETPISFNNHGKKHWDQVRRDISYYPEGGQTKTGIRVTGFCDGSHFIFDQWRTWFEADYTLWGQRQVAHEGAVHQGGVCAATGTRTCATYPAANLNNFVDKKAEAYKVWVNIRTPSGKVEDHFKVLNPTIATDRISTETVSVWVEGDKLMVRGPAPTLPPIKIITPVKPLPFKPLPIFKP